jgi:hypothetical protein
METDTWKRVIDKPFCPFVLGKALITIVIPNVLDPCDIELRNAISQQYSEQLIKFESHDDDVPPKNRSMYNVRLGLI